jgi:isopentenyl diphosphate isomerase/L-lactate dehydrogenase-like FMN-dependent dehydrogenase
VGRAGLYGVGAGGRAGAARAFAILAEELDRCLALLGCPSTARLDSTWLSERNTGVIFHGRYDATEGKLPQLEGVQC